MAIQETKRKITFVPFDIKKGRDKDTSDAPTITLDKGAMRFGKKVITELQLDGKFVKFYYDGIKKVVGFRFTTEVALGSLKGDGKWKMVKQNETNGSWTVSIRKMLINEFGEKTAEKKYGALPVQKYVEPNGMDKGMVFYFVEIVDEVLSGPERAAQLREEQKTVGKSDEDLEKALQDITAE